jgi:Zn-dependent protease/CBS domain-containing protein
MKWSIKLGKIAGIEVFLHLTTVVLFAWIALGQYLGSGSLQAALGGVAFVGTLFGIIVLHELGHALAARRYGIATRDITLLPMGGVARLERMPEDPKQELVVALAGPAVNVVLALLLLALLAPHAVVSSLLDLRLMGGDFLARLLQINVGLALFNLIPAFPMDGGRVLRALLAMRTDYVRATGIAAGVGQALALVFGFVGLLWNPFLIFIALFVWMGAAGEASMVQLRGALGGIPLGRAMMTDFRTLAPQDTLARATDHVLSGFQHDFPVVDGDGRIVGVLTRADLISALSQRGRDALVSEAMRREFMTADSHEMAEQVFAKLQECDCRTLPVTHRGRLIGLINAENVGEFLMIQAALRGESAPRFAARWSEA